MGEERIRSATTPMDGSRPPLPSARRRFLPLPPRAATCARPATPATDRRGASSSRMAGTSLFRTSLRTSPGRRRRRRRSSRCRRWTIWGASARGDAAAYEALRRRRETAAAEAAAANARALAAVSGPEAMRAVEAMEAEKREAEKREARAEEEKRAAALGGGAPGDAVGPRPGPGRRLLLLLRRERRGSSTR